MKLPYFMGETEKLQDCGIDTTGHRKSRDGTLCIVHMHMLSSNQFNSMRAKTSIKALSHSEATALMLTSDWSEEVVQ